MKVATTNTLVDAQADTKKINEKNAILRQETDKATSLRDEALADLKDIEGRKALIETEADDLVLEVKKIVDNANDTASKAADLVKDGNATIAQYIKVLGFFGDKIEEELVLLSAIKVRKKEEIDSILFETEKLDKLRNDLDIYRSRINTMIIKYNMGLALLE